jgi:hypothetical protein
MSEKSPTVYYEPGASWWWLLGGPIAALAMVLVQHLAGLGWQPTVPLLFLVVVSGAQGLQVKAARIHTSLELTREHLRQGVEITPLKAILGVYPEPENSVKSGEPLEKWQTSRAFGEVSGIPKRRTAIGVKLTGGRNAQAWARNDGALRAALTELVGEVPA